jgi:hypothetical protein
VSLACPSCGRNVTVTSVQGEGCAECRLEFTLFALDEVLVARDFHEVLTGDKHFVELGEQGFAVVHR